MPGRERDVTVMARRIGITTTVPVEIILAAGAVPVDLNNLFIASDDRDRFVSRAERDGYPRNVCAWIKGMYGVIAAGADIDTVVAVTQGDCSNTHALMETLTLLGITTIPFAYPLDRDPAMLEREMVRLASCLGTTLAEADTVRRGLEPTRRLLDLLDRLTWDNGVVSGAENHLWLVSSSDFNGDAERFAGQLSVFCDRATERAPFQHGIRLAYIGVPPILDDLYDTVEEFGAGVVFNEVQRQFSMPARDGGIIGQYRAYTYPYGIFHRLDYIRGELKRRNVHGVLHYVQSFCHRHIEDVVVRKLLDLPVLTIEGEAPGHVDARTKIRIQAFVEMLSSSREEEM